MNENELMSSLPVPKAVAKMAIPSVISSLVTVVYNMADTFLSDRPEIRCRWRQSASCLRQTCLSHFYRWDWQTECSRFWDITMVLEITSGLFPWNGIQKKCCVIVGILATALFFVLREPIIRLFISDGEVVYYGVKMLIAYMLSGPVIGLLFVNMNCMQSVGNSFPATILSVMRQGLLLIPLLYLLNACMGLNGVIYGQALTDYAAVILSAVLWRRIRRRIERR